MSKNTSEDVEEEFNEYEEDESQEEQNTISENINNKVSASDLDPERVLYDIKKVMNGFEKRDGKFVRVTEPLARSEFISLFDNSLRSLVNFHGLFAHHSLKQAAFSIMEGLKEITYAAVDYGVKEEHIETFINMYDNLESAYYGITIDGRGTENIKQVLTAVYKDLTLLPELKSNTVVNWENIGKKLK